MKYLATPEFSQKLRVLASDPATHNWITSLVSAIEAAPDRSAILHSGKVNAQLLDKDVAVARAGGARVFFSFVKPPNGDESVLLLDVAATSPGFVKAAPLLRDPRRNASINPTSNNLLNPNFNRQLNPNFNRQLNPNFNRQLNPNFNRQLNPNFNRVLNPNFNRVLNPNFNRVLNPNFNRVLNPNFNRAYQGPFLYSLNLEPEGYFVRASDSVELLFDNSGGFSGLAVANSRPGGRTLFDDKNEWIGYLVPAKNGVALRFTPEAKWTGFSV
jgi:hypothetical protein